ncbi:MAG: nucleoside deaminase [Wolbachia endosymbiont of Menacanthus eurysternus]|nr:MAG: nucleoside deaminase [Wolbachia endosymbiont of Menacanthus eurysternus]
MEFAIEQARIARKNDEVPIGAVLVSRSDDIISFAHNMSDDPTAHAEMLVIRQACRSFSKSIFYESDIYVTLEPCPMCIQAISFAKIRRLYFGAYYNPSGRTESGIKILQHCSYMPEIYGGILETKCSLLLKDFFEELRT